MIVDNFSGSGALTAHTADTGQAWTADSTSAATWQVASGSAYSTSGGVTLAWLPAYTPPTPACAIQAVYRGSPSSGPAIGLIAMSNGSADITQHNCYAAYIDPPNGQIHLFKDSSGGFADVSGSSFAVTVNDGDLVEFTATVSGSSVALVVLVNGAQVATATDSTGAYTSGRVGLMFNNGPGSATGNRWTKVRAGLPHDLTVLPASGSVAAAGGQTTFTPYLIGGGSLGASVSGGGTLSTNAPTDGVPFTYTGPSAGSGTATIGVTQAANSLMASASVTYSVPNTLAAGTASLSSDTATTANLSATAATGANGAVSLQWYRSTAAGVLGTAITGATALTEADSGLTPGATYYYTLRYTDSATTVSSNQVAAALPAAATRFTLTGPASLIPNTPATYTVTPAGGPLAQAETVALSVSGGFAAPSVASLSFASGATAAQTFTVTATSLGSGTLAATGSPSLGTPPTIAVATPPAATGLALTGSTTPPIGTAAVYSIALVPTGSLLAQAETLAPQKTGANGTLAPSSIAAAPFAAGPWTFTFNASDGTTGTLSVAATPSLGTAPALAVGPITLATYYTTVSGAPSTPTVAIQDLSGNAATAAVFGVVPQGSGCYSAMFLAPVGRYLAVWTAGTTGAIDVPILYSTPTPVDPFASSPANYATTGTMGNSIVTTSASVQALAASVASLSTVVGNIASGTTGLNITKLNGLSFRADDGTVQSATTSSIVLDPTDPRIAGPGGVNLEFTSGPGAGYGYAIPAGNITGTGTNRTATLASGQTWAVTPTSATTYRWAGQLTSATPVVLAANGLDNVMVENGINARQAFAPILAGIAGAVTGTGTGTITIKSPGSSPTTRITATIGLTGDRATTTLTLPT